MPGLVNWMAGTMPVGVPLGWAQEANYLLRYRHPMTSHKFDNFWLDLACRGIAKGESDGGYSSSIPRTFPIFLFFLSVNPTNKNGTGHTVVYHTTYQNAQPQIGRAAIGRNGANASLGKTAMYPIEGSYYSVGDATSSYLGFKLSAAPDFMGSGVVKGVALSWDQTGASVDLWWPLSTWDDETEGSNARVLAPYNTGAPWADSFMVTMEGPKSGINIPGNMFGPLDLQTVQWLKAWANGEMSSPISTRIILRASDPLSATAQATTINYDPGTLLGSTQNTSGATAYSSGTSGCVCNTSELSLSCSATTYEHIVVEHEHAGFVAATPARFGARIPPLYVPSAQTITIAAGDLVIGMPAMNISLQLTT